jgi:pyruvate dehydrogenase E2 component (dihydrolipoamide acetyltransferase)
MAAEVERESRKRMSRVRRTIAGRMVESWSQVPHITSFQEFDASALLATRAALADSLDRPVPVEALLLVVLAPLLVEFPDFNAHVDGEEVVHHQVRDVGVALDTPAGLLLPVVRGIDRIGIEQVCDEVVSLMRRGRDRELLPDEMRGATFTVSNLGPLGGAHSVSILPPGTSAFLSVGRARSTVVLGEDGAPAAVPMMPLDVTVDHRLIDGGPLLRFTKQLIAALEGLQPALCKRRPGS